MVGGVVAIMVKSVIIVDSKHPEPSVIFGDCMLTEYKLSQSEKQYPSKLVTDDGMVTEVKLLQLEKQAHPKLVTDDGMVIEVKLLQLEKQ